MATKTKQKRPSRTKAKARLLATLAATVIGNPYIPYRPHQKQARFLMDQNPDVLFGGAAGPGKSDGLLMAALQYATVPGYNALLLRRTFPMLEQASGLIPRSKEWLSSTDAEWHDKTHRWTFPSGATLSFGHCQYERDVYNYQSGEYQFIGFDELTQFTEFVYGYLHSRTRRNVGVDTPIRVRAASNPGGIGHEWVKTRFVDEKTRHNGCAFIPALLSDNPSIDAEEYIRSMDHLDMMTRQQLLEGDWNVAPEGAMFRREWFRIVDAAPAEAKRVRYWDEAASAPKRGTDPDWTAGARLAWVDGVLYIEDMQHFQSEPLGVDKRVRQTAEVDGYGVPIWYEQEPGASGKARIAHMRSLVLPDFALGADRPTGAKPVRAMPWASQAEAGNVRLVRGPWVKAFLDQVELFPYGAHDDMIDAVSGGYHKLLEQREYAFAL